MRIELHSRLRAPAHEPRQVFGLLFWCGLASIWWSLRSSSWARRSLTRFTSWRTWCC